MEHLDQMASDPIARTHKERDDAREERDAAVEKRDAFDALLKDLDASDAFDALLKDRNALLKERKEARKEAREERDALLQIAVDVRKARDAAREERDAAREERDAAREERDEALKDLKERDEALKALKERDAATAKQDAADADFHATLENLDSQFLDIAIGGKQIMIVGRMAVERMRKTTEITSAWDRSQLILIKCDHAIASFNEALTSLKDAIDYNEK